MYLLLRLDGDDEILHLSLLLQTLVRHQTYHNRHVLSQLLYPIRLPPDVEELGRSTWTLLHSLAATYPPSAPAETQSKTRQFLSLFAEMYPCWVCAEDFRSWMAEPENEPSLKGRNDFGMWMCRAHNAVNVKLGKPEFDCGLWKQRWKDGWRDGTCD